jgi:hypothetical protein
LRNQQIAMTHSLAIWLNPTNPDHHLWNNNSTWFVHYTEHRPNFTKHRIRMSLQTSNLASAGGFPHRQQSHENNQGAS